MGFKFRFALCFQGSELVHGPERCCPQCSSPKPGCVFEGRAHQVRFSPSAVTTTSRPGGEMETAAGPRLQPDAPNACFWSELSVSAASPSHYFGMIFIIHRSGLETQKAEAFIILHFPSWRLWVGGVTPKSLQSGQPRRGLGAREHRYPSLNRFFFLLPRVSGELISPADRYGVVITPTHVNTSVSEFVKSWCERIWLPAKPPSARRSSDVSSPPFFFFRVKGATSRLLNIRRHITWFNPVFLQDLAEWTDGSCRRCECRDARVTCYAPSCPTCPPGTLAVVREEGCCPRCQQGERLHVLINKVSIGGVESQGFVFLSFYGS